MRGDINNVGVEMEVIDSCAKGNGGCEHVCRQGDTGTTCSCREGYTLRPDRKSCEGTMNKTIDIQSVLLGCSM